MAGIHWIKNDYAAASEKYREVLQISEKYRKYFKTDTLQVS